MNKIMQAVLGLIGGIILFISIGALLLMRIDVAIIAFLVFALVLILAKNFSKK